jgi:hypothetical protein
VEEDRYQERDDDQISLPLSHCHFLSTKLRQSLTEF